MVTRGLLSPDYLVVAALLLVREKSDGVLVISSFERRAHVHVTHKSIT